MRPVLLAVFLGLFHLTAVFAAPYAVSGREIYVNHEMNHRSGHMGHATIDCGGGRILDFNSNCDGDRCDGHSGYGWMEYRISTDWGRTWGASRPLPYSKKMFEGGRHTALCEKGVRTADGRITLFFQITDATRPISCEPWSEPTYIVSTDGGETWSEGRGTGADPGRIYDALADGNDILFLTQANDASTSFLGNRPEHVYKVWTSEHGGPFKSVSLPFNAQGKGYGAMEFAADGSLIAYVYDALHEDMPEYSISRDRGRTWSAPKKTRTAKKIRNPQLRRIGDEWILVGRNGGGGGGLVLYHSKDGIHWDDGALIDKRPCPQGTGYYSTLLPICEPRHPPRMLLQYSHVYDLSRVNIAHRWITFPKVDATDASWRARPDEATNTPAWMVRWERKTRDPVYEAGVVPRDMKIFLLVGQSNMAGRGPLTAADQQPIGRCLMLDRNGTWVKASPPIHADRQTSGIGLADSFVRCYLAEHPGETVGLVPCAVGGSNSATWSPEPQKGPVGRNFHWAVARAKLALKNGTLAGILWHQGESDEGRCRRKGGEYYIARLGAIAASFRRELASPEVPFLIGEIGSLPKGHAKVMNPVLRAAADRIPNSALVPAADLTGHLPDGVHFDVPSYRTLGERYYREWKRLSK